MLVDLGCSDMKFFSHLLHVSSLQEVVLVDKDEHVLEENVNRVNPRASDWLFLRDTKLHVSVVCGDATIPHPVLSNAHAVTMIEVVEHLQLCEIEELVRCVFDHIRPGLVVVTTPNSDFNKYIPGFTPGSFRHWDHKFEWTAAEFQEWCAGVVQQYNDYSVEISGCGLGPDNTYCSQVATFIRAAGLNIITLPHTNPEYTGNTCPDSATNPHTSSEHTGRAQMTVASQCEVSNHSPLKTSNYPPLESTCVSSNYSSTSLLTISDTVPKDSSLDVDTMNTKPDTVAEDTTPRDTTYRLLVEYDYPYDRRTQKERDQDEIYGRFFCLRKRLQESLQHSEGDADQTRSGVLPPPLASLSPSQDTEEETTNFSIVYLPSEDLINDERDIAKYDVNDLDCAVNHVANNGRDADKSGAGNNNSASNENTAKDKYIFYIVNLRYAILPVESLCAWMNYDASRTLTSDIVRLTVAEECFETTGSEQDWKGRLLLLDDDDDDDDDDVDGGWGDDDSEDSNRGNSVGDEEWWNVESNNGDGVVESGDSGVGESWSEVDGGGGDVNVEVDLGSGARRDECGDEGVDGGGGKEKCCIDEEARECSGVKERREREQHCGCGSSNNDGDASVGGERPGGNTGGRKCSGNGGGGEGESEGGISFGGVGGKEARDCHKRGRTYTTTDVNDEHSRTTPQTRATSSVIQALGENWDSVEPDIPLDPNWL